jgi:hypothetical protein
MRRIFCFLLVFLSAFGPVAVSASPQTKKPIFKYEDKIGVVKVKSGEPTHIACWFAVAGSEATLGIDSKRGVEIAIQGKGGKILDFPIKIRDIPHISPFSFSCNKFLPCRELPD